MRAKFVVNAIEATIDYSSKKEVQTVKMNAVMDSQNKTWSQWTPSGSVSLTVNNPEAVGFLKLGQHYFLDFSEAPAKEADEAK